MEASRSDRAYDQLFFRDLEIRPGSPSIELGLYIISVVHKWLKVNFIRIHSYEDNTITSTYTPSPGRHPHGITMSHSLRG